MEIVALVPGLAKVDGVVLDCVTNRPLTLMMMYLPPISCGQLMNYFLLLLLPRSVGATEFHVHLSRRFADSRGKTSSSGGVSRFRQLLKRAGRGEVRPTDRLEESGRSGGGGGGGPICGPRVASRRVARFPHWPRRATAISAALCLSNRRGVCTLKTRQRN